MLSKFGRWRVGLFGGGALLSLLAAVTVAMPRRAQSQPYTPRSGKEVLVERLPGSAGPRLPQAAISDPKEAERLATEQLKSYVVTADPRFLGRAEALLASFWQSPEPPLGIAVVRAKIRAANHDFDEAVRDLDRVLDADPQHVQARFERLNIFVVQTRFDAARKDCAHLQRVVSRLLAVGCRALVDGVTGRAGEAAQELQLALAGARGLSSGELSWIESLLGELWVRSGDAKKGERTWRGVLQRSPDDVYVLAVLSDLLLDQQRFAEVVELLARFEHNDALLLRLAIAESNAGKTQPHVEQLEARFAAARRRGSALHGREEARFELFLKHESERSLQLATENFVVQREVQDARVLLEAALAAGRPASAQTALQAVRASGLNDPVLARLARTIEERFAP